MKCEQMHELFSPYLDKMTTPQEAQSLEAHLQACPICKRQMEEMRVMCTLLKSLDVPQVPASFAEDLHKHLEQEKIKIFASKELKAPRKPSWLVAGVAGIALSIGIYASSFLPFGTMMASVQNWVNKDNDKPSVAVVENEKVLNNWANKDTINSAQNINPIETAAGSADNKTSTKPVETPDTTQPVQHSAASANIASVEVKERVADNYVSTIKVGDIGSSLQKLAQIADANGAKYTLQSSSRVVAMDAASTKVITLQVPKDKADQVLKDLAAVGAGVPAKDSTNYTQAYAETEKTLAALEQDIKNLKSQDSLNAQQLAQLQQLENKQIDLLSEKQRIDKEYETVTIEVRLAEALKP